MREPIELIEYRLLKLGLPPEFVAQHLQGTKIDRAGDDRRGTVFYTHDR